MKRLWQALLILAIACLTMSTKAEFEIHFLDVSQGDAAIVLCDGESMLIDGGPSSKSDYLYSYIRNHLQLTHLEYIISTHPHEDHAGGIPAALNAVPVDLILSPVLAYDSKTFTSLLRYADAQGTPIIVPSEGDTLSLGSAVVTIVHCWPEAWGENDMSIVVRIDYGSVSALFTGDAEEMSEYIMIDSGFPLQSNILKVGHHGSASSTTAEFLKAVNPQYAVISCGSQNEYGHPNQSVLDLLQKNGVQTYRTDLMGTVIARVQGDKISIATDRSEGSDDIFRAPGVLLRKEQAEQTSRYIINMKTRKYHIPSCEYARKISTENRKEYIGMPGFLIEHGYTPCRFCCR